jgi:hypothetical protein
MGTHNSSDIIFTLVNTLESPAASYKLKRPNVLISHWARRPSVAYALSRAPGFLHTSPAHMEAIRISLAEHSACAARPSM